MARSEKLLGALRISLYWQEHVAANALNHVQRERCRARAAKLAAEIAAIERESAQ